MNRKQFIESHGATCRNWTWSWSFVNEQEKFVIFGVWDEYEIGGNALILDKAWQKSWQGKSQAGYTQAREHIRLIGEKGYKLKTFSMQRSIAKETKGLGRSQIEGFTPILNVKNLFRIDNIWYAGDTIISNKFPEESVSENVLLEGAARSVFVNTFERNPEAKKKCIEHHGYKCGVCKFDFEVFYGSLGRKYIHVHHIVPLSTIRETYAVDPIHDLIPICPNCHAMIHNTTPALTVEQLRNHLTYIRGRI